eukprot:CAMPEP_0119201960 /NCGR_PEP_ID=MMETSP1316-20130426/30609_1 /TAXON_ID=41880 /ORGANISM="Pycnococcus provasolii, Strain RCC2336" /LENGTH=136 /DNA_ID=CAMNT_0007198125 /DNA_START=120 /DNA_END=530 /DNA_ORIENTATION=-
MNVWRRAGIAPSAEEAVTLDDADVTASIRGLKASSISSSKRSMATSSAPLSSVDGAANCASTSAFAMRAPSVSAGGALRSRGTASVDLLSRTPLARKSSIARLCAVASHFSRLATSGFVDEPLPSSWSSTPPMRLR